jgi:hypothetical protein
VSGMPRSSNRGASVRALGCMIFYSQIVTEAPACSHGGGRKGEYNREYIR